MSLDDVTGKQQEPSNLTPSQLPESQKSPVAKFVTEQMAKS